MLRHSEDEARKNPAFRMGSIMSEEGSDLLLLNYPPFTLHLSLKLLSDVTTCVNYLSFLHE